MRRVPLLIHTAAVLAIGLVCHGAQPLPDFRLPDVNPKSVRHGIDISPRDYRLQISGYYFGAAG